MLARARQSCFALTRCLPRRPVVSLAGSGLPKLSDEEMVAAVSEMNEEMDMFFGDQGGPARLADTFSSPSTRPRAEAAADQVQQLTSALAQNQDLIAQQQQLAGAPAASDPEDEPRSASPHAAVEPLGGAPSRAPEPLVSSKVAQAQPGIGAASGPVTQVFNGPVTLHQHFHVTVVRPGDQ